MTGISFNSSLLCDVACECVLPGHTEAHGYLPLYSAVRGYLAAHCDLHAVTPAMHCNEFSAAVRATGTVADVGVTYIQDGPD